MRRWRGTRVNLSNEETRARREVKEQCISKRLSAGIFNDAQDA